MLFQQLHNKPLCVWIYHNLLKYSCSIVYNANFKKSLNLSSVLKFIGIFLSLIDLGSV